MYIARSDFRPDRLPERFVMLWERRFYTPRTLSQMRRLFAAKHQARQRRHDRKAIGAGLSDLADERLDE